MHESFRERELSELEHALASLSPAPAQIDRDGVLFRAGQAAATRRTRRWQFAAALGAVATASIALAWIRQPLPESSVRIVHVQVPAAPSPAPEKPAPLDKPAPQQPVDEVSPPRPNRAPATGIAYLTRQRQLLRWGLDGLESLPAEVDAPRSLQPLDPTLRDALPRWPSAIHGDN